MQPALFAFTLFVSAALLFAVQPLVGKMVLPLLGGTPAVWNTCMVFFQGVLLAGYLYAHRSTTRLGIARQAGYHLGLLACPVLVFIAALFLAGNPVPLQAGLLPVDQDYPVLPLLAVLTLAVGVPFFVLSTTAPLLQRWYAAPGGSASSRAYSLYAASNAGSLLGLLGYPLLIEPWLELPTQGRLWAAGATLCLVLVGLCALSTRAAAEPPRSDEKPAPPPTGGEVLSWVALAALPSALLLAVTTVLTSDVAPVPLLWVVPLALYLISFILVFAWWPAWLHTVVARINLMLLVFVTLVLATASNEPILLVGGLHLGAFFGTALVCHGELVRRKPPGERLTAFYLSLSVGGVLGGLACALVAPLVFHRLGLVEYPLCVFLAALVRPGDSGTGASRLRWTDLALPALLGAVTAALVVLVPTWLWPVPAADSPNYALDRMLRIGLTFGLPAVVAYALVRRPLRFALALAALWLAGTLDTGQVGRVLSIQRNFFGTLRVTRSRDGRFIRLVHGTTQHGQQRLDEEGLPTPLMYYHPTGPIGRVFHALPPERQRRVGVIGLGCGAMAAYARPGQQWKFFEIDPAVVRIARDSGYFTYLERCQAPPEIVLGDARLQMERRQDTFDVLALDAFSSDAIPVHLLTREALTLYLSRLAPGGVLAFHVSNRYLDLPPLLARLAAEHDPPLEVRVDNDMPTERQAEEGKYGSTWVVIARREADLGRLARDPRWQRVPLIPGPVWTDHFSNLLGVWRRDEP